MARPLVGAIVGAACGVAGSVFLGQVAGEQNFVATTMPGAIALGALLGWCVGRLGRLRLLAALSLGPLAAFCNAPLSGFVDWAAGDPMHLGVRHGPLGTISDGLLGAMILSRLIFLVGLVAGIAVFFATRQSKTKTIER